jgi:hypothetical protein
MSGALRRRGPDPDRDQFAFGPTTSMSDTLLARKDHGGANTWRNYF